jgi:hypothetical protein
VALSRGFLDSLRPTGSWFFPRSARYERAATWRRGGRHRYVPCAINAVRRVATKNAGLPAAPGQQPTPCDYAMPRRLRSGSLSTRRDDGPRDGLFFEAPTSDGPCLHKDPRGARHWARISRRKIRTMMQSCASDGKAPGGGAHSLGRHQRHVSCRFPPPRIVNRQSAEKPVRAPNREKLLYPRP